MGDVPSCGLNNCAQNKSDQHARLNISPLRGWLCSQVGHPLVLADIPHWSQLMRFCMSRCGLRPPPQMAQ